MSAATAALLREVEIRNEPSAADAPALRRDGLRHHIINRLAQERSGRLYCPFDVDFEIPSLEIYAAR
jgi:hypothetical protein